MQKIYSTLILYSLVTAAYGQPLPDAGSVNKQLPPLSPQLPSKNNGNIKTQPVIPNALQDSTTFDIKNVRITGNTLFTDTQLQPLVADLVGSKRTFSQAQEAANRITDYYRKEGYIFAQAGLFEQTMQNGTLTITVFEGILSKVTTENNSRLSDEQVQDYLDNIPTKTIANESPIRRAILLLGDVPGIENVEGRREAGEQKGETALVLSVKPQPVVAGKLEFDNYGSLYTGRYRFAGMLDANSALGYGERFSAHILGSDNGLIYGHANAQMPLGNDGLTIGLGVGHNVYSLGNTFAVLDALGSATTVELNVRYPWLRSLNANVYSQASFEHRERRDEVRSTLTKTDKSVNVGTLSLQGDVGDELLFGRAVTEGMLAMTNGYLAIDTPSAAATDKISAKTAGYYTKFSWNFRRQQQLLDDLSLSMQFSGQWTYKNLDSWEKLGLGGPNAIRGYAISEAMGDIGWLTRLELRYTLLPQILSASVFHDRGWVMVNAKPYINNAENYLRRSGTGLGLDASYESFDIHAAVAWRGSQGTAEPDKSPRFWIQTSWRF